MLGISAAQRTFVRGCAAGGAGMVSLGAYDWLAIGAKDELCTTSRDVDRRGCLRPAGSRTDSD